MNSWILQKLGGRDVSLLPTDELEVPVRVANMLKVEGIHTVGQLATKSEAELLRCPNFGRGSLQRLKEALDEYGVELESSEILDMEQQMKRAMARARAAKVAYAEAALEVQRIAKRLAETDLTELILCES